MHQAPQFSPHTHPSGESRPLRVGPGSVVPAGSLNADGLLAVRVTATSDDSTPARIARMTAAAQVDHFHRGGLKKWDFRIVSACWVCQTISLCISTTLQYPPPLLTPPTGCQAPPPADSGPRGRGLVQGRHRRHPDDAGGPAAAGRRTVARRRRGAVPRHGGADGRLAVRSGASAAGECGEVWGSRIGTSLFFHYSFLVFTQGGRTPAQR